jgi:NadR type nicotinamide-nucleotide adenylyltransferase
MKKYRKGVITGKFYIYHLGHYELIKFGIENCDELHVLVEENSKYGISAAIRASWIEQDFPTAIVHIVNGEPETEDASQWGWRTRYVLRDDKRGNDPFEGPDVVFSSEDYGEPYAKSMGAEHVMVDRYRSLVPCSGHELRANIMDNFKYLSRPAKADFAKRIIVVGPDSSGKTTLAQELAEKYNTVWVPEYGRMYWDGKIGNLKNNSRLWHTSEFAHIAKVQSYAAYELSKDANKVIIEDTDGICTELWHQRYRGYLEPSLRYAGMNRSNPYIYVLAKPDFPFVQDGTRENERARDKMYAEFRKELSRRNLPYTIVSGSIEERVAKVSNLIEVMLANQVNLDE